VFYTLSAFFIFTPTPIMSEKRNSIDNALKDLLSKGYPDSHYAVQMLKQGLLDDDDEELVRKNEEMLAGNTKNEEGDSFLAAVEKALSQPAKERGSFDSEMAATNRETNDLRAAEKAFGANPKEDVTSSAMKANSSTAVSTGGKSNTQATYDDADIRKVGEPDMKSAAEKAFGANPKEDITSSAMRANSSTAVEPNDDAAFAVLFKATHGTKFDPKSRVDREKISELKAMAEDKPELLKLSPNKFALNYYRNH
jgi:hypothetical protein